MPISSEVFRKVLMLAGLGVVGSSCQEARTQSVGTKPIIQASSQVAGHNPDAGNRMTTEAQKDTLASWTRRFRRYYPNEHSHPRAFYMSEKLIADVLKTVNSEGNKGGLRLYMGIDAQGVPHLIAVAVNRNGTDVIERKGSVKAVLPFITGETNDKCPANCDGSSRLMK